jgi:hypothetical protein
MADWANQLRKMLESGEASIHWRTNALTKDLAKWIAFHDGDKDALRAYARWAADRDYKIDTIPQKLSVAWADFLYGEDPLIVSPHEENQELLDALLGKDEVSGDSDFIAELHSAVDHCSAEGEQWWRIYTDPEQSDYPIIDWQSRSMVVPLMRGKKVLAVAFIDEVERSDNGIWRYVQLQEEGYSYNLLYFEKRDTGSQGSDQAASASVKGIGEQRSLTSHPATAEYPDIWHHGLNMLAGRIPNGRLGRDPRMGISDYSKVEDHLFDLNEAHTIDTENYRLAGKKRAVMPERFAKSDGTAEDSDVYFSKEDWDEMDGDGNGPFKILEYTYDGTSSINRKEDLVGIILTRLGLARQFVDANAKEGYAESGTARRIRLIPTSLAARGKSRRWDAAVPYILMQAQLVDALPEDNHGFNRKWQSPGDAPSVERASVLPEDPQEVAERHARAVGAGLESVEHAVDELHPDWDEDEKKLEVFRIRRGLTPLGPDEAPPSEDDDVVPE